MSTHKVEEKHAPAAAHAKHEEKADKAPALLSELVHYRLAQGPNAGKLRSAIVTDIDADTDTVTLTVFTTTRDAISASNSHRYEGVKRGEAEGEYRLRR